MNNFEQLFQNAALDAAGILDGPELDVFERDFLAASPAVRAQLRELQDRIVQLHLAAGQPVAAPASCRDGTLLRIGSEMARDAAQHAQAASQKDVVAVIRTVSAPASSVPVIPGLAGPEAGHSGPWGRVHGAWRAGAIGSMAAMVVFGVVFARMLVNFQQVESSLNSTAASSYLAKFSSGVDNLLLDSRTSVIQFQTAADPTAKALVLHHPETQALHLLARDIKPGATTTLALVVWDGAKAGPVIQQFPASATTISQAVPQVSLDRESQLAIIDVADPAKPLLVSRPVASGIALSAVAEFLD